MPKGLAFAARHGIATAVVDHKAARQPRGLRRRAGPAPSTFAPDLVLLAGFMRILGAPLRAAL
jgi:phosphoribosylglycinamide formyltransferase-1